jgi:hypothetical protein
MISDPSRGEGCPSYSGGWQLGDIDLSEYLAKYRDHEVEGFPRWGALSRRRARLAK